MAINANYVVRETTANLARNITLTVASILTVFVTLAIVGTIVLVRQGAQNLTSRYQNGVEFIVYVDPDISKDQLADVRTSLEDNPRVREITYVDRDETYADFKELFKGQDTMLENVTADDLPTSFRVKPTESDVTTVQELVNYYRKQPGVYEVSAATEVIRQLKGMSDFLNQGLTVFGALLLAASALLILNTVRTAMFARRREIEVHQGEGSVLFARPAEDGYAEVGGRVVIAGLSNRGPARKADLRVGDVVLRVGSENVTNLTTFFRSIWSRGDAGVTVPITVHRSGRTLEVNVASVDRRSLLKGPVLH